MLVFIEGCSQKTGGPNRTVEIDESKFGRRKYPGGHPRKVQWVSGGVERGSGRKFLVPVPDRTADTLATIIHDRFEPATTIVSDCWSVYRDPHSQSFTHRSLSHSIHFVDPNTGDHTNIPSSTSGAASKSSSANRSGRLPLPPGTRHVCGEVQGSRNTRISKIPSPHRQTPTGPNAMCIAHLQAPCDRPAVVHAPTRHLPIQVRILSSAKRHFRCHTTSR